MLRNRDRYPRVLVLRTVEAPQNQFIDGVVVIPVVKCCASTAHGPDSAVVVLTVLKIVEVPQLQYIAELVEMPDVQFPKVGHVVMNVHDKFQQLIMMMRSGVETFIA